MKKIVTLAFMMLTAGAAVADEKINTFLYYSPGGTYDRINQQVIAPVLGNRHNEAVRIKGCSLMKNYIEQTDQKMFGIWDLVNNVPQSNGSQNPCYMPEESMIGVAFSLPFYICYAADEKNKGLEDFINNPNIKVGMLGYSSYYAITENIVNDLNNKATLIPYNSSKVYLPALASGEVDYLFSIQKKNNMTCVASTHDKSFEGMQALEELSDSVFANRSLFPVFIFKNMSAAEAETLYREIVNSVEYKSLINVTYQKPGIIDLTRNEQMQILNDYQQDLFDIIE